MAVNIQRDRDARVPEHLGDDLRVHAFRGEQRRAGVPEVVEAHVGQGPDRTPRFCASASSRLGGPQELDEHPVRVAPAPPLAGLEGGDHRAADRADT